MEWASDDGRLADASYNACLDSARKRPLEGLGSASLRGMAYY